MVTIPTFEQFISTNEGLWSSGMKRAENDEKRLEDMGILNSFQKYIQTIEWVDLGDDFYEFAKVDYKEMISMNEFKEIRTYLQSTYDKQKISILDKQYWSFIYKNTISIKKPESSIHDTPQIILKNPRFSTSKYITMWCDEKARAYYKINHMNDRACVFVEDYSYSKPIIFTPHNDDFKMFYIKLKKLK